MCILNTISYSCIKVCFQLWEHLARTHELLQRAFWDFYWENTDLRVLRLPSIGHRDPNADEFSKTVSEDQWSTIFETAGRLGLLNWMYWWGREDFKVQLFCVLVFAHCEAEEVPVFGPSEHNCNPTPSLTYVIKHLMILLVFENLISIMKVSFARFTEIQERLHMIQTCWIH
jgi:hypothetical protein